MRHSTNSIPAKAIELAENELDQVTGGGDGTYDSIWMDLSYPIQTAPPPSNDSETTAIRRG